jgi:hypothetical protein
VSEPVWGFEMLEIGSELTGRMYLEDEKKGKVLKG